MSYSIWRRPLPLVALLGVAVGGCSGTEELCAEAESARLCIVRNKASYQVKGEGLAPGAAITLEVDGEVLDLNYKVGDDGAVQGFVGVTDGQNGSEPEKVAARTMTADGAGIAVETGPG